MRTVVPLALACLLLAACEDSNPAGGDRSCLGETQGVIQANHEHSVGPVCLQDRGSDLSLTLTGGHEHVLDITSEQIDLIFNPNTVIVVSSTTRQHEHPVIFN